MKKCLVTGAAGFIGSHLVDSLLADGHQVIGVDNLAVGRLSNLKTALLNPNFTFHEETVINRNAMTELCVGQDWVAHLAAMADIVPSIENPEEYFDANVNGTYAVIEAAKNADVKRFVYSASSSCYGIPDKYPTKENAAKNPKSYRLCKAIKLA